MPHGCRKYLSFMGKFYILIKILFVTFSKVMAINLKILIGRLFICISLCMHAFISNRRVHWCWEETASPWCFVWRDQEQKTPNMAEDSRTNNGEISAAVCGAAEKSHCQGGLVPVQKHLPAGTASVASETWQMCNAWWPNTLNNINSLIVYWKWISCKSQMASVIMYFYCSV